MFEVGAGGCDEAPCPLETAIRLSPTVDVGPVDIGVVDWCEPAFEVEVTLPDPPVPAGGWEEVAVERQDLLVDLDRELRLADAARTVALLRAYDASLRDLGERYGAEQSHRGSLGAQTFFQTTGLQLSMSPLRVAHLVDTATTLRDRLPLTWDAYLNGAATWRAVDTAVAQADGLDDDRWPAFDEQAAVAVVETPASRLKGKLRSIRERLQDDTAPERAKRTREMRNVVVDQGHDGKASLVVTGPAIPIVGFDEALTKAAIAARMQPEETRTIGQLRHDIVIDLLVEGIKQAADPAWAGLQVPGRKGVVPSPILTIPVLAALGRSGEQARLAGYGPIDLDTAKQIAGTATSFVRVLTDPVTGVRVDMDRTTRVPPADMRRWVTVRDEICRFPGCLRPAHLCDLDHATEWQHAGVTALDNLVALSRPHHLAKTLELWNEELLRNGTVDWENPWGEHFTDPPPDPADPAPTEYLPPSASDPDPPCPF